MFVCVRNLTPENVTVMHEDREQQNLNLGPYEAEWLRNPKEWGEENPMAYDLHEQIRSGRVELVEMDFRPKPFRLPSMADKPAVRPRDIIDLKFILIEPNHERAMGIIQVNPLLNTPDRKMDTDYLKRRLLPILEAALNIYEEYGEQMNFPDRRTRERAIKRRIKEIAKL